MKKKQTIHGFCESWSKLFLVMRLSIFLFFAFVFAAQARSFSQSSKLTLDLSEVKLLEVLDEIEQQTDYYFYFNLDLDDYRVSQVKVKDRDIKEVLNMVLPSLGLDYQIVDRYVVIKQVNKSSLGNGVSALEQENIKISGEVTDESGDPLPGVTVFVKGTAKGTVTDADGKYFLSDISSDATLIFSFVGMKTQEIEVNGMTRINVKLSEEAFGINEVVAIGYGTMKKSDLTGSVVSVKSDDLNAFPSSDAVKSLQGRAAGVQIQSDNGGEPGGSYNILIRGISSVNASSEPLYVVDGFPEGTLPQPEDIESVEVLKDASATAIYGSRGANGVVMITTKKGSKGAVKVKLNTSYSVQNITKKYDLLNASQYAEMNNALDESLGQPKSFDNPSSLGVGTDWQDEIFRIGNIQNYNLSVSGGSDKVDYYVSGSYFDQKGIVLKSDYRKYSLNSNINIKASDFFKLGVNVLVGRSDGNRLRTQEQTTSTISGGITSIALVFDPTEPIKNEDGSYSKMTFGEPLDNPVAVALERPHQIVTDYMQSSVSGDFNLLKNLDFKAVLGMGTNNSRTGDYISTKLDYGNTLGGLATVENSKYTNMLSENYLTYSKDFGNVHSVKIMGGYSYQTFSSEYFEASASNFITDAGTWWALGNASTPQQPYSSLTESKLSSFFGRINYSLLDRYLFTFNARYDGSSRFAANNKWAFFPSGAFAWNVYKENFLKDSKSISQLKFRVSYGIAGNQAIEPYQSLARIRYNFSVDNGVSVNGVSPVSVANKDLTWESTAQTDMGFDLGLFNNHLVVNADYYNKVTSDLLFEVPLPQYTGYYTQLKNVGKIGNEGFEIAVQLNDIVKVIHWNSSVNFSTNKNTVLELPDGNDILYATAPGGFTGVETTNILKEGEPLGAFYGFVYEGVQQSGDQLLDGAEGVGGERFKDVTKDGVLNDEDRTIIGNPNPKFHWGWNNSFAFKNFDLSVFVQGTHGNDMANYTRMSLESLGNRRNSTTAILDSWTPTHTDTKVPKIASRTKRFSSRYVEDGSYIRLENVMLGYSLPKKIIQRISLGSVRFYVSGQKLLTITNYSGFDPEVSWSSGNTNLGMDYGSYPNTRSFTFGVNVGF